MSRHILLLGGHGKIAQLLTPLLLKRSWTVTSVIRSQDQVPTIKKLGKDQAGELKVLVRSVEEVKSEAQAKAILDEVKPHYVVWSAGAGGKGAPERTDQIDRDAAIFFIKAAVATPSITKFLLVSFLDSRRALPSWWDEEAREASKKTQQKLLRYYQAKIAADEVLYTEGVKRSDFAAIDLRPGTLSDKPAGPVELGKTKGVRGTVSRESVAVVADLLLATEGVGTRWVDLLDGEEDAAKGVERIVKDGVDATEGEPFFITS